MLGFSEVTGANLSRQFAAGQRILFRHLGEFVGEGVDDELEAIGDSEF